MVFGAGLRVWRWACALPLWLDEQMIAGSLRGRGFAELAGPLDSYQSAPLGWLWVQRAVIEVFGTGERALRAVPVLFGIGTIVVAWLIARRWLGLPGTVTLVGFCAVNAAMLAYSTQVKHYSADFFWALVLLGLAGWALEEPRAVRRHTAWWGAAVVGSWLSMGVILITPGLALVLLGTVWRHGGWVAALRNALLGLVWSASFAVHYLLALRQTTGSSYMQSFWSKIGYPPISAGLEATVRWFFERMWVLAEDPLRLMPDGVDGPWLKAVASLFWLAVLAGIVAATRHRLAFGLLLAAPVLSASLLAAARVVPLVGRLTLWMVPSLFLAVACAFDAVGRLAARTHPGRPTNRAWTPWLTTATGLLALAVLLPSVTTAVSSTVSTPPVDDRASVAWMQSQHRPGDLTLVVGNAGRALEWYDPAMKLRPAYTVIAGSLMKSCDPEAFRRLIGNYNRIVAYSGDRIYPHRTTYLLVERELARAGQIVQIRHFGGGQSTVYVVDLRLPPALPRTLSDECLVVLS